MLIISNIKIKMRHTELMLTLADQHLKNTINIYSTVLCKVLFCRWEIKL